MRVLFVFGTRPEAIKLAPLVKTLRAAPEDFDVQVCVTGQHREMLDQVLHFFQVQPEFDLDLMESDQTLFRLTSRTIDRLHGVLKACQPDNIVVQGDASSCFLGALAGHYFGCTVSHVEAGLRSRDKRAPFPEEMNRILTGHIADYHFAPTDRARENLANEGIDKNVWVVGNTVIDALHRGLELVEGTFEQTGGPLEFVDLTRRIVLITGHRRESFGLPFENIARAIGDVARRFPDVQFLYPVHLNPNVKRPVERLLGGKPNVHLLPPLDYPEMIWLLKRCYAVLTDSGGIQEEAPALGKPVLVMRDVTERVEGIEAGTARLVGTERGAIAAALSTLLSDSGHYRTMAQAVNPYGDGNASQRIAEILRTLS